MGIPFFSGHDELNIRQKTFCILGSVTNTLAPLGVLYSIGSFVETLRLRNLQSKGIATAIHNVVLPGKGIATAIHNVVLPEGEFRDGSISFMERIFSKL